MIVLMWIKRHKVWSCVVGLIVLSWILGALGIDVMVVGRFIGLVGGLILIGWLLGLRKRKKG